METWEWLLVVVIAVAPLVLLASIQTGINVRLVSVNRRLLNKALRYNVVLLALQTQVAELEKARE